MALSPGRQRNINFFNHYIFIRSCKKMFRNIQRILFYPASFNFSILHNSTKFQNHETDLDIVNRIYSNTTGFTCTRVCVCVCVCTYVFSCNTVKCIDSWNNFHNQDAEQTHCHIAPTELLLYSSWSLLLTSRATLCFPSL